MHGTERVEWNNKENFSFQLVSSSRSPYDTNIIIYKIADYTDGTLSKNLDLNDTNEATSGIMRELYF